MHINIISFRQIVMSSLIVSSQVFAEPMAYTLDSGAEIYPEVTTFYELNDNIARTSSAQPNENVSTWGVEPEITLKLQTNRYRGEHSYKLMSGFSSGDKNDYLDHDLHSKNFVELNSKHHLVAEYRFRRTHEDRGTGLTESDDLATVLDEQLEYNSNLIRLNYIYGSAGAKGRIEAGLRYHDKRYLNFRSIGENQGSKFNDSKTPGLYGEFYVRFSPNRYWLIGTQYLTTSYSHTKDNSASRDSSSLFYYTGASWSLSGKTEGIVRIGAQDKTFDDSKRDDFTGLSWDIGLNWLPQEHTLVELTTAQAAINPDQDGDYNLQTRYRIKLTNDWSTRISSHGILQYQTDEYTGAYQNSVLRDEDKWSFELGTEYHFRRWLSVKGKWRYEDKDSNWFGYGYQQNVLQLSLTASL